MPNLIRRILCFLRTGHKAMTYDTLVYVPQSVRVQCKCLDCGHTVCGPQVVNGEIRRTGK